MIGARSEVGTLLPEVERRFTEADIAAYADVSGAGGRIHLDPAFARQRGFEGAVVHGQSVLGLAVRSLNDVYGPTWAFGGTLSARYLRPVVAGQRVRVQLRVAAQERYGDHLLIVHDLRCINDADEPILAGEAHVPRPSVLGEPTVVPDPQGEQVATVPVTGSTRYDDLTVGIRGVPFAYQVTDEAARALAEALGDPNPVYVDDTAARQAGLPGQIAPILLLGFMRSFYASIQAVVGSDWPQERIHTRHTFRFFSPPVVGDTLVARAEIVERELRRGRRYVTFRTTTVSQREHLVGELAHTELWT